MAEANAAGPPVAAEAEAPLVVTAEAEASPPVAAAAEAPPVAAAVNAAPSPVAATAEAPPVASATNVAPLVAAAAEVPPVASATNAAPLVAAAAEVPPVASATNAAPLVAAAAEAPPVTAAAEGPAAALDPQVFMAARRGDSNKLKELLLLEDVDEQEATAVQATRPHHPLQPSNQTHANRCSRICCWWRLAYVEAAQEVAGTPMAAAQDNHISLDVHPTVPGDAVGDAVGVGQQQQPAAPSAVAPLLDGNGVPVEEAAQVAGTSTAAPQPQGGGDDIDIAAARRRLGSGVTMEGDSVLHVVAACGDCDKFIKCAKMMVRAYAQGVLRAQNGKGDTPLHCAAGAGNAKMISCLLELAGTDDAKKALVRTQNQFGETALHQAIRAANNKEACIDQLMSVDPTLACIPGDDDDAVDDGASSSPLYLAISLGELEIAGHLFRRTRGNLSYSGPHGRNVLHAAVSRGQALPMVLNWLKTVGMQGDRRHGDLLLQQLTSQKDKQSDGSSPLQLAAALSGWPSGGFLAKWFPQVWSWPAVAVRLLLDANKSTAYQPDNKGSYPIHVAAWSGSLGAVESLLQQCPDCATLRDGQGRTFLHVAAETEEDGADRVVEYACRNAELSSILNAQDRQGDTALHKAVRAGKLAAFHCLFRNRQVRLDVENNEALTPLDLSWSMIPPGPYYYGMNPRTIIDKLLETAGAPHGGSRPDLFRAKHVAKKDEGKASEVYNYSTQALGIVSVLIATVTFASAFTLPGGYRSAADACSSSSSDSQRRAAGTPVLAGVYAFQAFVVADTLAFLCSSLATFSIVYAGIPAMDLSIRLNYFALASFLLHGAGRSFVAAFALGLYLVLAPVDQAAAAAVCVFSSASLLFGNMEAWLSLGALNTVRSRLGTIRIPATRIHVSHFILWVWGCYWPLVLIFGLPALFKWANSFSK